MSIAIIASTVRNVADVYAPLAIFDARLQLGLDAQYARGLYTNTVGGTLSTNGADVQAWRDRSSYARHATYDGVAPTCGNTAINSKRAVVFVGTGGFVVPSPVGGLTQFEVWCVCYAPVGTQGVYEDYNGGNGFFQLYCNSSDDLEASVWGTGGQGSYQTIPTASVPHLVHHKVDTTLVTLASQFLVDNDATGLVQIADNDLSGSVMPGNDLQIGQRYDGSIRLTGSIGELVIVSGVCSGPERTAMNSYLKTKWGTP